MKPQSSQRKTMCSQELYPHKDITGEIIFLSPQELRPLRQKNVEHDRDIVISLDSNMLKVVNELVNDLPNKQEDKVSTHQFSEFYSDDDTLFQRAAQLTLNQQGLT